MLTAPGGAAGGATCLRKLCFWSVAALRGIAMGRMMNAGSKEFGLLLAHFFGNDKALLSVSDAAGLSGFGVKEARNVLKLLESEEILSSLRRGRGRFFRADSGSKSYSRCRAAYAVRPQALN